MLLIPQLKIEFEKHKQGQSCDVAYTRKVFFLFFSFFYLNHYFKKKLLMLY